MTHNVKNITTNDNEDEEEQMTIYLNVTKTVALRVKESDSIGKVKSLLHDKEGILECLQQLFSKDVQLTDEQKLVDYGIIKNSILHAHIDNSVPRKLLVKRPYAKGPITVYSRISDTIQDIKYRIGAREGVKSKEFSLVHDGKFLEDEKTLAFYKIDGGSMLHIVFNPRDKFLISVVMPTEEIVQIEVRAALTVRHIKTIIECRIGCLINSTDLFLGKQKLDDPKTLYQCGINVESVLQVKHKRIQILINKSGGSITLDVHRHELVKNVKRMLLMKLGIPVHRQKLLFEGKSLADSRDLASYNIRMHSNIIFDFRGYPPTTILKRPLSNIMQASNTKSYQQISLCTLKGKVSSTTSVAHLKTLIKNELKIPVKELFLGGKILDSSCCLGKYGITKKKDLVIAC